MFEFLVILFTAFFVSGIITILTVLWYGFLFVLCFAILSKFWNWLMEE